MLGGAFDNAFTCGFSDCITACIITFLVTMFVMFLLHIALYFKFVKIARQKHPQPTTGTRSAAQGPYMSGQFADTSVLNDPPCKLPNPYGSSSICTSNGIQPSAEACSAACLQDARCTAYTWHNNPDEWQNICVFRTDGSWQTVTGAKGHTSGQKIKKALNCPPGYSPTNSGTCTMGWTSACDQGCAMTRCRDAGGSWVPLDYKTNPYTCIPKNN